MPHLPHLRYRVHYQYMYAVLTDQVIGRIAVWESFRAELLDQIDEDDSQQIIGGRLSHV